MSAADSSSLSSLSPPPSSDEGRVPSPPRKIIIPPKSQLLKSKKNKEHKENDDEFATDEEELAAQAAERSPSPPHETVLADNPDIAFIVMFRSRFSDAFPKSLAHFGPQDIEKGVVDVLPTPQIESLLCALLALVLNRKKPVERGHHGRALEDAIQSQKNEWPRSWEGRSPLSGGKSFNTMDPAERLALLKALVLWSLHTSEAVSGIIKENYKVSRREDDVNISLSVQPWGRDAKKHRYWLVEGQDDTSFRVYRESNQTTVSESTIAAPTDWRSMAGSIDELREVAEKLGLENAQASRRLSEKMTGAIPRFEATEEKRKRREYRMARKAQFIRPEPGFSLYEGRTRGKRMKYTFSDDDNDYDSSDAQPYARRSLRHAPVTADPARPVVTASGRQSKPNGRLYGDSASSEQHGADANLRDKGSPTAQGDGSDDASENANGNRPTRSSRGANEEQRGSSRGGGPGRHIDGYNSVDEMEEEDEAEASSSDGNGGDWDGGEDEYDDVANGREEEDEDDEMSEDEEDRLDGIGNGGGAIDKRKTNEKQSLVIQLRYGKRGREEGGQRCGVSTHHQGENVKNEQHKDGVQSDEIMSGHGEPSFDNDVSLNMKTDVANEGERYTNGGGREFTSSEKGQSSSVINDTAIVPPLPAEAQGFSKEYKSSLTFQLQPTAASSAPAPAPIPPVSTEHPRDSNKLNNVSTDARQITGSDNAYPQQQLPVAVVDMDAKSNASARSFPASAPASALASASTPPPPTSHEPPVVNGRETQS